MTLTQYRPQFPYLGNQVIISSGRVVIHSKDDAIFIFGKKAVSISSPGTFNIDANSGTVIASPKIELGLAASKVGQQVIKGNDFIIQLERLLNQIAELSEALSTLKSDSEGLAASIPGIVTKSEVLRGIAESVKGKLAGTLSNVTYTL